MSQKGLDAYEDFHRLISAYLSLVAIAEQLPQATDCDKRSLEQFRQMLNNRDISEIEKSLSEGKVVKGLEQIAKFYKDLSDFALEHINESQVWKQIVRQATHQHIDDAKNSAKEFYEIIQRI